MPSIRDATLVFSCVNYTTSSNSIGKQKRAQASPCWQHLRIPSETARIKSQPPYTPRHTCTSCPFPTNPTVAPPVLLRTWPRASTQCCSAPSTHHNPSTQSKLRGSHLPALVRPNACRRPLQYKTNAHEQAMAAYTVPVGHRPALQLWVEDDQ